MSEPLTVEETGWARWGRRAVTVPLYLLLGTFTVALLPVTITLALASDALRRTGHLVTLRCTLAITLYFTCEAVGIVASFVLWVADRALAGGHRGARADVEPAPAARVGADALRRRHPALQHARRSDGRGGGAPRAAVSVLPAREHTRHAPARRVRFAAVHLAPRARDEARAALGPVPRHRRATHPQRLRPPRLRRARQGDCAAAPARHRPSRSAMGCCCSPRGLASRRRSASAPWHISRTRGSPRASRVPSACNMSCRPTAVGRSRYSRRARTSMWRFWPTSGSKGPPA